jgi:prepilin-type processing-associated H-X9-DG protein
MRSDKSDEKMAELLDRARPAYDDASRERALSAMARSHAEGAPRTATRRRKWIVRAAAAAVVAVLGLGLFVMPGRLGKRDVDAILADVAHAMASADSMLWVCELTDEGLALSEQCWDDLIENALDLSYYGPRAAYTRRIGADGVVLWAEGISLDTLEWWLYTTRPRHPALYEDFLYVLYVADLAPVEAEVADYLSRPDERRLHEWPYTYRLHAWPWMLAGGLDDQEVSVTRAIRDGREVTVVTFTGWETVWPKHEVGAAVEAWRLSARNVLEVDAETDRLQDAYFHWQFEGGREQLVAHWRAEYDGPMPAIMAELPDAGEIVEATVAVDDTIQSGYEVARLSMWVGDDYVTAIGARSDQYGEAVSDTESTFKAGRTELDQVMKNMMNVSLAVQMHLADHENDLPPVDNVDDLMTVLDQYVRSRSVFMRCGTEDEVVVEYLVPLGVKWMELEDFSGTPIAVADYHPDFAVFAYADGHVDAADKSDPAYQDRWWEDWWREYQASQ